MRQRRPYVNHEDFRSILVSTLSSDGPNLVTIRADSGKGKSTLLSWFEDQCRIQEIACTSLTFREAKSYDGFQVLDALMLKLKMCTFQEYQKSISSFLPSSGTSVMIQNVALENSQISGIQAIGSNNVLRNHMLAKLCESWFMDLYSYTQNENNKRRVVIILDTFEEASNEVKSWLEFFLQIMHGKEGLALVIAGREKIQVDLARWEEKCYQLELPSGLEFQWWREYAKETGAFAVWGEEHLQRLHKLHSGDPQMMSILCDLEMF